MQTYGYLKVCYIIMGLGESLWGVCVCVCVCVCTLVHSVTKWCLTVCDPMDGSPPDSSVHGIVLARILQWVAIFSSRESS